MLIVAHRPTPVIPAEQEKLWRTLSAWPMDRIKANLAKKSDLAPEHIEKLEGEYKRYLFLRAAYPGLDLPMSVPVDPMWHAHILFTADYRAMCERVIGRFIDHKPMESKADAKRMAVSYRDNLIVKYTEHFGEPDQTFWPVHGEVCVCNNGQCDGD